ncbi:hypothetical protein [Noviherbaspirillum saxi]|uniref:hypothetical protein n=1 Tax=Noviherbaspirillum saxi TaxID=2320863 RepID=UPI0011C351F5|nr:hypothetical protein [Noviherbaspirillum saxi]
MIDLVVRRILARQIRIVKRLGMQPPLGIEFDEVQFVEIMRNLGSNAGTFGLLVSGKRRAFDTISPDKLVAQRVIGGASGIHQHE